MQTKIQVRMVIIKNTTTNVGEVGLKEEPLCTIGVNVNKYNHYGKQYGNSLKN
jgi:hypothetical protein